MCDNCTSIPGTDCGGYCGLCVTLWTVFFFTMGLGAHEDGHCSGCDTDHLRPWGTQCLAVKAALQQCKELNIDESEYKAYLDLDVLRYAKDLPPGVGKQDNDDEVPDIPAADYQEQIRRLTNINLQQKSRIDSLLGSAPVAPPPQVDQTKILQQIMHRLDRLESTPAQPPGVPPGKGYTAAGASRAAASKSNPDPAVAAMGQMADAMAQLSISIDPSCSVKSGQLLRPDYQYCVLEKGMPLKSADASKMTINEYLYGMCLVLDHLITIDGDWRSYFDHYKRIMRFFVGKKYVNSAYVSYDKEVVDSYLKCPSQGFNSSDSLAIPTHFCSANEHETQNARSSRGGMRRSYRNENKQRTTPTPPEDWPEDVCYVYNSAFCNGSCNKQHVCGRCQIRGHKIASCRVKIEKN